MSRLVAPHLHPVIGDQDVVITADVDAFIMTPDILQPLQEYGDKAAWVWQYETTATKQWTFAMSFVGRKCKIYWSLKCFLQWWCVQACEPGPGGM